MTFLEKIHQKIKYHTGAYESNLTRDVSVLADDYAIDFARFVGNHIYSYYENDTWSNDLEKKDLTTKELLEIFKKQKQL